MNRSTCCSVAAIACLVSAGAAFAADQLPPAATTAVDFTRDVQPIFAKYCVSCHGAEKQKAKLRFDQQASVVAGGESGEPTYVVGKSAESHLIKLVAGVNKNEVMPPKGDRLSAAEVGILRAWIDQGAKWADGAAPSATPGASMQRGDHWSFQPVKRPAAVDPAKLKHAGFVRNPIDGFIVEALEAKGLSPSPQADPATLIRRAYLILTGLPPTAKEVEAFAAPFTPSPPHPLTPPRHEGVTGWRGEGVKEFDALIDKLLASPRYGERWARHWLDVVRFAETNGFETNTPRPNAYHYRDYVIRAFNENKPFDRFLKEQLAGDAFGEDAATGFLVGGSYDVVRSPDVVLTRNQRANELHDMVSVTGSAMLGLTTGCARCHNHKFDPVSQQDYYAMVGVFAGVNHGDRAIRMPSDGNKEKQIAALREKIAASRAELAKYEAKLPPRRLPVNAKENEETFAPMQAKFVRFTAEATNSGAEPCIDELEVYATPAAGPGGQSVNVALASAGAKATSSGNYAGNPKHQLKHINDGKYSNDFSWISNQAGKGWVQIEFASPASINRIVWGRDRTEFYKDRVAISYKIEASPDGKAWAVVGTSDTRMPFGKEAAEITAARFAGLPADELAIATKLVAEAQSYEQQIAAMSTKASAYAGSFSQPGPTKRLFRGDPMEEREEVLPGAVASLGSPLKVDGKTPEQQRRLALADWIASKDNPLTARVMVNRIWLWHFGEGLVATPSDFGKMGAKPSNAKLLDWLADEFVRSGWDVKHIQKLIVTSATWQQSSDPRQGRNAKGTEGRRDEGTKGQGNNPPTAIGDPQPSSNPKSQIPNPKSALDIDADSRLLWRFPPRRLEAEIIRDNILAVAGTLDLTMGGPGWNAFKANDNYVRVYTPKESWGPGDWRRMVYMYKVRMEHDSTFGAFDCPDAGQPTDKRGRSTTALQALNLLNSEFVIQQADLLAGRIEKEAGKDADKQIRAAFQLCFGRTPDAEETSAASSLVGKHGLKALCRAMMNANEFLFVR